MFAASTVVPSSADPTPRPAEGLTAESRLSKPKGRTRKLRLDSLAQWQDLTDRSLRDATYSEMVAKNTPGLSGCGSSLSPPLRLQAQPIALPNCIRSRRGIPTWEASSLDKVRDVVEAHLGHASKNEYISLDPSKSMGLPTTAAARA